MKTVNINEELLKGVKRFSIEHGLTITEIVEVAIKLYLENDGPPISRVPFPKVVVHPHAPEGKLSIGKPVPDIIHNYGPSGNGICFNCNPPHKKEDLK